MNRRFAIFSGLGLLIGAPAIARAEDRAPTVGTLPWNGGSRVEFGVPAMITLIQSPQSSLVVRGPKHLVDRVYVDGRRIGFRGRWTWWGGSSDTIRGLSVEMSGPAFDEISVHSAGNLNIVDLRADRLELNVHSAAQARAVLAVRNLRAGVHSAANLRARGTADTVDLQVHSAAKADLGELVANHVRVNAHSAANATVNAVVSGDARASSAASVRFIGRPQTLVSSRGGAGSVSVGS